MFENLLHKKTIIPEHTHEWVLTAKTIGKPKTTLSLPNAHQVTIPEKAILGATSYLYFCACGTHKTIELLGFEEVDPMEELAQDVEKYGQAKFSWGNRSYAILLDTTAPQVIPVRLPVQ